MGNNTIQNSLEKFTQRGLSFLQTSHNNAVKQIVDNLKLLNLFISKRTDSMALLPWSSLKEDFVPSDSVAPSRMRFGVIQIVNSKGDAIKDVDIPLLLSTKVNAVLLDLADKSEKVPSLFQNIILRLLLSMRMDLVETSIVDMDFGASFPIISTITNTMFKNEVIYRQEDITKLIDKLEKEISEANKNILGRCQDIGAFNANNREMAHPYHFVFIDDFPNGFTSQSIDGLLRIIENGNAFRSGIIIFINYSAKNPRPRDFDLNAFVKCCSCAHLANDGKISFHNWDFIIPKRTVVQFDLNVTDKANEYVEFINGIKAKSINYTLDGWIEQLKNENKVWKGSTIDGIKIPIGYISPTKHFDFYMANDNDGSCNDFFALIAGRPGYGKTVLLHNIIVNSAMKYSPDELCLYLADFAEGASFSIYRELPHVKSLMLANNKEYALRMLEDVVLEAKKRSHLYQKAQKQYGRQITKLSEYREVTNEKLPRILFVMDEFHTLFISTDNTTIRAKEVLCNGIRQWRKFGISIILCTQSINGVSFGNADTQITYRFALNLLEMDSKSVIRNDAAKSLVRKGQTIMNNTADGRVEMNIEFQSAFSPHYLEHVKYLSKLYADTYKKVHIPYLCESVTNADVVDNQMLKTLILADRIKPNYQCCDVFVGKPNLLREAHTRIRYRRQQNSNTLVIGDDFRTLIYSVMVQLIQLLYQSHMNSKFYLVDCFNVGDVFNGALDNIKTLSDCFIVGQSQDVPNYIDSLFEELERRKELQKQGIMSEERIALTILNTQNSYELRAQQGKFGTEQSAVAKKLVAILSEGAPLGIHCIIHGLSYETLFKMSGVLESNKHFSMFENLILLKGADVMNMFLGGIKVAIPEEEGQMIVINAKIDGETYEQCDAYSDFTTDKMNDTIQFMSNTFEKYRYV